LNEVIDVRREWWRQGESESSGILKTHNLLNFETPKTRKAAKLCPAGTHMEGAI
jgi:hypothetical protein